MPTTTLSLTIRELPPNVIQINWERSINEHVDYFELSIKNISASVEEIGGNTILLTNIKGCLFHRKI